MASISRSSTGNGFLPQPTTCKTPGVTIAGRRCEYSNRQKTEPGNSGCSTSLFLSDHFRTVLYFGRKHSNPCRSRLATIKPSLRTQHCSTYQGSFAFAEIAAAFSKNKSPFNLSNHGSLMGYRHKPYTSRRCEYHGQFTCHSLPRASCAPQPLFNSKPFVYNDLRTGMTKSVGLFCRPACQQEKSPTLLLQTFPEAGTLCALSRPCAYQSGYTE